MLKPAFAFILWTLLLTLSAQGTMAQIEVRPNVVPNLQTGGKNARIQKTMAGDALILPFWDDFSGYWGAPDTTFWEESVNVSVNHTMGINPPSIGVATMDGMTGTGRPYSANEIEQGVADILMSRPINLDTVPNDLRNTVYLSFFWQIKGKGEMPNEDEGDGLSLQFKNEEGEWDEIWSPAHSYGRLGVTEYHQLSTEVFFQELIAVDSRFFQRDFQFRFQTTGRLAGPFDTWNLDYIYLNYNRHAADYFTFDRTLTKQPTSIFAQYHAIPMKHFKNNPEKYVGLSNSEAFNLDNLSQSVRYSVTIFDTLMADKTPVVLKDSSFVINSLQRVVMPAGRVNFNTLSLSSDSAHLKTQYIFLTGDMHAIKSISGSDTLFYTHVDFRSNDTTSIINILHNFYAYDDGTAEFNAGIGQQFGKLAYQYIIGEEDTLKAIQIHFPGMTPSPAGRSLELTVWEKIGDKEVVLARRNIEVQTSGTNQFTTYELTPAIMVKDTFYLGWSQSSDGYLGVGLDKNTNSGDRIWYNIDGTWVQNSRVEGSLMVRPVFGRGEVTTSISEELAAALPSKENPVIYPNPGKDVFFIKGSFEKARLFDFRGVEMAVPFNFDSNGNGIFDLTGHAAGLYIIHLYQKDQIYREKIILK